MLEFVLFYQDFKFPKALEFPDLSPSFKDQIRVILPFFWRLLIEIQTRPILSSVPMTGKSLVTSFLGQGVQAEADSVQAERDKNTAAKTMYAFQLMLPGSENSAHLTLLYHRFCVKKYLHVTCHTKYVNRISYYTQEGVRRKTYESGKGPKSIKEVNRKGRLF